jgi:hypothetical protein
MEIVVLAAHLPAMELSKNIFACNRTGKQDWFFIQPKKLLSWFF